MSLSCFGTAPGVLRETKLIFFTFIFILLCMCVFVCVYLCSCMCVRMCHSVHMEVRGQLEGVDFLLLPCGSWKLSLSSKHPYLLSHLTDPCKASFLSMLSPELSQQKCFCKCLLIYRCDLPIQLHWKIVSVRGIWGNMSKPQSLRVEKSAQLVFVTWEILDVFP